MKSHEQIFQQLRASLASRSWDEIKVAAASLDQIEGLGMQFSLVQKLAYLEQRYPDQQLERGLAWVRRSIYQLESELKPDEFVDLSDLVARHAIQFPEKIGFQDEQRQMNWGTFDTHCTKVANGLLELELPAGSRIGVIGETVIEYLEIFVGALRAGYCIVPLSTLANAQTLQLMGKDADIGVWFVSGKYRSLVEPFEDQLSNKIALDFEEDGWLGYQTWRTRASEQEVSISYSPDSQFDIIYSSGTTGIPKGIIHSREVRKRQYGYGHRLNFWKESITIISTPLYSNTTMVSVLRSLGEGGKMILMRKFRVEELLQICEQNKVTHAVLVPVQLQRIMAHPKFETYDLSQMELIITTSAPLSTDLKRDIITRMPGTLLEIYGMTEGGVLSILDANAFPDKLHTVGKPTPTNIMKVIDEEGSLLPQGEIGELIGYDLNMMDGYHNRPEVTSNSYWYDEQGRKYMRSGDYGKIDEDGFVILHGRKKEVIISGGFNIYAVDLEELLKQHESVVEAAVIGIPSETWGETPLGLVEAKKGSVLDPETIKLWANARLGKGQRLHAIEIRDELPRSPIGKVLKKVLRKPYWE
ncbi:MAG: class I adenylate-forming enzyme family protein [Bacteroidota bacterium]